METVAVIKLKGSIVKVTTENNVDKTMADLLNEYFPSTKLSKVKYLCNHYGYAYGYVLPEHKDKRVHEDNLLLDFEWFFVE